MQEMLWLQDETCLPTNGGVDLWDEWWSTPVLNDCGQVSTGKVWWRQVKTGMLRWATYINVWANRTGGKPGQTQASVNLQGQASGVFGEGSTSTEHHCAETFSWAISIKNANHLLKEMFLITCRHGGAVAEVHQCLF